MEYRPGGRTIDEVDGMLTLLRALWRAEEGRRSIHDASGRERVTRQELANLFADDLCRTVLHKRTAKRGLSARRFMAVSQSPTLS